MVRRLTRRTLILGVAMQGVAILAVILIGPPLVSADFGPQLTPYTGRGSAMLAFMSSLAAAGVIVSAVHRRRQRLTSKITPSFDTSFAVAPIFQGDVGSRLRPLALGLAQILAGILFIVLLSYVARRTILAPDLPPGWQIIRPPNEATVLVEQGQTIWAGGRNGLWAIDKISSQVQKLPAGAPDFRRIRDLLVDDQQRLWIAHQDGLTRFDGTNWEQIRPAGELLTGPAYALLLDNEGKLWVGTDRGAAVFDGQKWLGYSTADGLSTPAVSFIFQDWDGLMWFGSDSAEEGGLTTFDGREWRSYSVADGLAHNSINMIIQDRQGALWFATGFGSQGGASRLIDGRWESWRVADGLAGGKTRSIYEDTHGRLWFGSEYDGLAVYDGGGFQLYTPQDGLAGWEVKQMIQDSEDIYWLGTENGLSRIDGYDGQGEDGR
jgi:ligand-binding sensor domain-containing protein